MKRVFGIALVAIIATGATCRAAIAMPVFAEAYGYDCQMCHVQVPALNSFGRQVQRSMYATLDRKTLSSIAPVWVGESVNYDTQSASEAHRPQFGNLAVHASGYVAPDVTTHVQQWLTQNDLPGGLDTAWVSYDHLFGKNGHFAVGKMPPPGPSAFSQWMDLAGFAVPGTTIGEHALAVANNRWGVKAGWNNDKFTADAGWFGSGADLNGATDFSNANDKGVQWHVAYAPSDQPVQAGLYGSHGTAPLAEGGIDRYAATGIYVQTDPTPHAPGVLLLYQRGWDGNAGQGLGSAASSGSGLELSWKPLRHYEALLSVREEVQNDGLGSVTHSGNVDLNVRVARFVHATLEEYAASNARPGTRYQVWWTTPLQRAH